MLDVNQLIGFGVDAGAGGFPTGTATWNPADTQGGTLSGGNLTYSYATYTTSNVRATLGKSSGKWYWEVYVSTDCAGNYLEAGVWQLSTYITTYMYSMTGISEIGVNGNAAGATYGFALDMTVPQLKVYKNNTLYATKALSAGTWYPVVGASNAAFSCAPAHTANFGASAFTYAPPAGFTAGLY